MHKNAQYDLVAKCCIINCTAILCFSRNSFIYTAGTDSLLGNKEVKYPEKYHMMALFPFPPPIL